MQYVGTNVYPSSHEIVPAISQKLEWKSYEERIEMGFLEGSDEYIDYIAVYSSPLEAPFASSTPTISGFLQRQFSSFDYHAFIVVRTNHGQWLAVDKMRDGIYISEGESEDSVVFYFDQKPRPRPLKFLIGDTAWSEEYMFLYVLLKKMESGSYDIVTENC